MSPEPSGAAEKTGLRKMMTGFTDQDSMHHCTALLQQMDVDVVMGRTHKKIST